MVKIIETYARDLREIDLNAPRDMTMHPRDGQSPKGLQLRALVLFRGQRIFCGGGQQRDERDG